MFTSEKTKQNYGHKDYIPLFYTGHKQHLMINSKWFPNISMKKCIDITSSDY